MNSRRVVISSLDAPFSCDVIVGAALRGRPSFTDTHPYRNLTQRTPATIHFPPLTLLNPSITATRGAHGGTPLQSLRHGVTSETISFAMPGSLGLEAGLDRPHTIGNRFFALLLFPQPCI